MHDAIELLGDIEVIGCREKYFFNAGQICERILKITATLLESRYCFVELIAEAGCLLLCFAHAIPQSLHLTFA